LQQQARSWQVLQQLLSVPPRGVQTERILWHDQQIQLSGWALSAGHGQAWLTGLALAGALIQADKAQWEEPNWRMVQGLAAKQHRFHLQIGTPP
jgi:Tfp pilus assembly protein PilN